MSIIRINIQAFLDSPLACKAQEGSKLYETIHPLLKSGREVELDFTGIKVVVSLFLNFSVGHLVKDCDISKLKFIGLDEFQKGLVDAVLINAQNYYASLPQEQESEVIEFELNP